MAALACLFARCAHPVSPQGGPRDTDPPLVVATDPPNYSTLFRKNSIRLDFDEFITLKNASAEILVSPPQRHTPDTRLRGKSLIISIEDTLSPNTTYSVTFGKAIADITEGNLLKDYAYIFSTGAYIDSLTLKGDLREAFDLKPAKGVFVGLYNDSYDTIPFDSLPLKVPPAFVTRTGETGDFRFMNLRPGPYRLCALSDQNSDLVFNQPAEKIAFSDSLVSGVYEPPPPADTARAEPGGMAADTAVADSGGMYRRGDQSATTGSVDSLSAPGPVVPVHHLYLFAEIDSVQRLVKSSAPSAHMAQLVFRFPVKNLDVEPMNFDTAGPWCLREVSTFGDTVRLWITRPGTDSLVARVIADGWPADTIQLGFPGQGGEDDNRTKRKPSHLSIASPATMAGLNQFRNDLVLRFSSPVTRWNPGRMLLTSGDDTLVAGYTFDDSLKRRMTVRMKWEEDKSYRLLIPDSVFFGIGGESHDTVALEFRTRSERDFGNLIVSMNMSARPGRYILRLINESETAVYEERLVEGTAKIRFEFLVPGKYKLKAIADRNRNGRWDTGNYRKKLQPEEVSYYGKTIEVRANWEIEETWD